MIPQEELRHVVSGPRIAERPGGAGLVGLLARADDIDALLDGCREVMTVVLGADPPLTSLDDWAARLPPWFVDGCAPETSAEHDAEWLDWWRSLEPTARADAAKNKPWSLSNWVYWLQPDERTWFWWDGYRTGHTEARILVEVPGWPAPTGSLEWLLRAAGASFVHLPDDLVH